MWTPETFVELLKRHISNSYEDGRVHIALWTEPPTHGYVSLTSLVEELNEREKASETSAEELRLLRQHAQATLDAEQGEASGGR